MFGSKDGTDDRWDCYVAGVGPGVQMDAAGHDGKPMLRLPTVKRGDKVIFNAPQCQHFELFGYKFILCPNVHVFGIVDDEAHEWLSEHKVEPPLIHTKQSFPLPTITAKKDRRN